MTSRPPYKSLEERTADYFKAHPRLAVDEASKITGVRPNDLMTLGVDDAGRALKIDDKPRLEHMHVIGATGCGKSTFLLNCILQISPAAAACACSTHRNRLLLASLQYHRRQQRCLWLSISLQQHHRQH